VTDKPISKGPKKRDPVCYQLQRDIVIPAGTILRASGRPDEYETAYGYYAAFVLRVSPDIDKASGDFKKVIAA